MKKMLHIVVAIVIILSFLVVYVSCENKTHTEERQSVEDETTKKYKDERDVAVLNEIINEQIENGATVSRDLDHPQYKWDEMTGRLIGLRWDYKGLSGTLNLNKFDEIKSIDVYDNKIEKLVIKNLQKLEYLECSDNKIKRLDVQNLKELQSLSCYNNEIKELDLKNLENLNFLSCSHNKLKKLEINEKAEFADSDLDCSYNDITELIIKSDCVTRLYCDNNKLEKLEISEGCSTIELYCYDNNLKELDLSSFDPHLLKIVKCQNNDLTEIDLTSLKRLKRLYCDEDAWIIGAEKLKKLKIFNQPEEW